MTDRDPNQYGYYEYNTPNRRSYKSNQNGKNGAIGQLSQSDLDHKIENAIKDLMKQPQSIQYIRNKVMGKKTLPGSLTNMGGFSAGGGGFSSGGGGFSGANQQQQAADTGTIKKILIDLINQEKNKTAHTGQMSTIPAPIQTVNTIPASIPTTQGGKVVQVIEHPSTDVYYDVPTSVYYPAVQNTTSSSYVAAPTSNIYYTPKTPGRSRVVSYGGNYGINYGANYYPNSYVAGSRISGNPVAYQPADYTYKSSYIPRSSYTSQGRGYYGDNGYDRVRPSYGYGYGGYDYYPSRYGRSRYRDDYDYDYDYYDDEYPRRSRVGRSRSMKKRRKSASKRDYD